MSVKHAIVKGMKNPLVLIPKPKTAQAGYIQQWQRGHTALEQIHTEMQQQGLNEPPAGATALHPQAWRAGTSQSGGPAQAGMNLGVFGDPIPPELVISIDLNSSVFEGLQRAARSGLQGISEAEILDEIRSAIYIPLQIYMIGQINQWAPKDSGRLRNALQLSIGGTGTMGRGISTYGAMSQTYGLHPFYVVLSSLNVPYAGIVNLMPTQWLQHTGFAHANAWSINTTKGGESTRYGRTVLRKKGPHRLNDPTAETDWFHKILNPGRTEAEQLWRRFTNSIWVMNRFLPLMYLMGQTFGGTWDIQSALEMLFTVVIP